MKINDRLEVELLEVGGLRSVYEALRLPYGLDCRSESSFVCSEYNLNYVLHTEVDIDLKDMALLQALSNRGDEHAKCIRGLMYYLKITAPRWWWIEMDTYVIGTIPMGGTSTMHIDCKGLSGEELMKFKDNMSQGNLETRIRAFSLQTLQRIHAQRFDHRLNIWKDLCKWIKTLPMSELITGKE